MPKYDTSWIRHKAPDIHVDDDDWRQWPAKPIFRVCIPSANIEESFIACLDLDSNGHATLTNPDALPEQVRNMFSGGLSYSVNKVVLRNQSIEVEILPSAVHA